MPVVDLVIKEGKMVTPSGVFDAGIAIDDGKIVSIAKEPGLPKADKVVDAKGNLILPGVIDAHVHTRDPGTEWREDFESGTKAAAAGGITSVLEMPISMPAVSSVAIFNRRRDILSKKAVIDFGLYGGFGTHNIDEICGLAKAGAVGYKTLMVKPPPEREKEFRGIYVTGEGSLFQALQEVAKTGLPCSIHAENDEVIEKKIEELKKAGRNDPMAHVESRPNFVEAQAIYTVISFCRATGARGHIAHMSTSEGVELVRESKRHARHVTAETCPQYLTMTAETMKKMGPYAKINPPLRSQDDVDALWRGLNDGTVDIIASDHAPYTKQEKDVGWTSIWNAFAGAPQLETMLPLMLTKVNEGRIPLYRLVQVMSESVAKLFGLYPKKGCLQVGSDGDVVIVDLKKEGEIESSSMYTKARDVTLYDGWHVKGMPVATILRGMPIMEGGVVLGKPGLGEFMRPNRSGNSSLPSTDGTSAVAFGP